MNKSVLILSLFILFLSCSNNDSDANDRIIGKWQVIETYQSDALVETNDCFQYIHTEFKSNAVMSTGFINSVAIPSDCIKSFNFTALIWKKISDNLYNLSDSVGKFVATAYIEGANLVIELSDQPRKQVHKSIE